MSTTKPRNGYVVTLPDGRQVEFVELRSSELKMALQVGGKEKVEAAQQYVSALEGLRQSIRKIGGRAVVYTDLIGDKLDDEFSIKEIQILVRAWNQVHSPTEDEVTAGNPAAVSG